MIRLLIAEDQGMVRGALAGLLELEDDITVVAQAVNGEEAVVAAAHYRPDIAVLDIEMPKMTGLEAAEQIVRNIPACRIIIVTTFARVGYLQRALKAGAKGYLLKDSPIEELVDAIRGVHQGKRVVSPELMMSAFDEGNPLTEREQDILRHAAVGKTTQEIAKALYLSEGTVRNYLSEIFDKMHVKNRMEAVRLSEEKGWI